MRIGGDNELLSSVGYKACPDGDGILDSEWARRELDSGMWRLQFPEGGGTWACVMGALWNDVRGASGGCGTRLAILEVLSIAGRVEPIRDDGHGAGSIDLRCW